MNQRPRAQHGGLEQMLFEIGRVCLKIAGRDAGKKCIVIDNPGTNTVLIDGETRRRKCNVKHLEPLDKVVSISKNAPPAQVLKAGEELGFKGLVEQKNKKEEKPTAPKKQKAKKQAPAKGAKQQAKPAVSPKKAKEEKAEEEDESAE